jgi:Protein of unknown function (DUF1761)
VAINYVAVIVATLASWVAGAAWYGVLGKVWTRAVGWRDGEARPAPMLPMAVSVVAELLMAVGLAGLISHLVGAPTVRAGLFAAALSWLSFVLPSGVVNNAFQGRKVLLTLIDTAHWLIVLLIQGVVLGFFG